MTVTSPVMREQENRNPASAMTMYINRTGDEIDWVELNALADDMMTALTSVEGLLGGMYRSLPDERQNLGLLLAAVKGIASDVQKIIPDALSTVRSRNIARYEFEKSIVLRLKEEAATRHLPPPPSSKKKTVAQVMKGCDA